MALIVAMEQMLSLIYWIKRLLLLWCCKCLFGIVAIEINDKVTERREDKKHYDISDSVNNYYGRMNALFL